MYVENRHGTLALRDLFQAVRGVFGQLRAAFGPFRVYLVPVRDELLPGRQRFSFGGGVGIAVIEGREGFGF